VRSSIFIISVSIIIIVVVGWQVLIVKPRGSVHDRFAQSSSSSHGRNLQIGVTSSAIHDDDRAARQAHQLVRTFTRMYNSAIRPPRAVATTRAMAALSDRCAATPTVTEALSDARERSSNMATLNEMNATSTKCPITNCVCVYE